MGVVIEYRDFDLAIEEDVGRLSARVLASPAGTGSTAFQLPFGDPELNDLLAVLRDAAATVPVPGAPQEAGLDRIRAFGGALFDAVFQGVVGDLLRASLMDATRDGAGVRLRLRLDPALSGIPWELLYNRPLDRFLSLSAETPVVRLPEVSEPVPSVPIELPVRVLVMISSPPDHPPLDVEAEWTKLNQSLDGLLRAGSIALERLDDASLPALQDRLAGSRFHVFHFLGHGGFDTRDQSGVLLLEGPRGLGVIVPGHDLGVALHDAHLRLAVLNTCEGARGSARDPFAGTAQGLVQQGVPAVVAMQFEISDEAATTVAQEFYSAIAMGFPVDAALAEARKAVYFTGNRLEWATPVLYLRAPDGRLFDVAGTAPPVATRAEVDPLAPVGAAAPAPAGVVYAGAIVLALRDPAGAAAGRTAPEERPVPRLRRPPIDLRPKDFADLLGRDAEVATIAAAFLQPAPLPIEVSGPDGAGKTALLRNVAHHPAAQFPDGAVYSASAQPASDLLQFLFQTFYETPAPLKPTEAELRQYLHDVRALVELDDLRLARDDVELLANVLPNAQFVLSARERVLWQEGPAVALHGLAEGAALALLERRLGRAVTVEEQQAARALVAAVGGLPLELVKAASRVRDDGVPLAEVAAEAAAPPPPVVDPASLTGADDRVRAVLQTAGAPLHAEVLGRAAELPDPGGSLEDLEAHGVIRSNSPRYDLTEPLPAGVAAALDATPWPAQALERIVAWAEEHRDDHPRILEEIDGLAGMLAWAERNARWPEAVRLGRAIEGALAEAGRWGRWEAVLVTVLGAARALGDRTQEARALHQLGTRALALDQATLAALTLRQALAIREETGDAHGIDLTRRNLDVATGGTGPHGDGGGGGPPKPRWWLRILIAVGVAGLAAAGALIVPGLLDDDGVVPPGEAAATVEPGLLEFDDQLEGTASVAKAATIRSGGDVPLEVGDPRIEGSNPGDFQLGPDTCSGVPLDRGQECVIQVAFAPSAPGSRSATLVLGTNAPGGAIAVDLTGVGLPAGGGTTPPAPRLELDPPAFRNFLKPTERQLLTVVSTGTAPLQVLATVQSDEESPEFVIDDENSTCQEEVEPGGSCSILVVFEPREGGTGLATLVIESNAGDPISLPLAGTPFAQAPASADFSEDTATITVTNVGTASLVISEVTKSGEDEADFQITDDTCTSASLVIGGSCTITVVFRPDSFGEGTSRATITIVDNSPQPIHDVALEVVVVL